MRLYTICKALKWNHLPVAGGIYAQHPKFLDDLLIIFNEDVKAEEERRRKEEARQKSKSASMGSRGGRGRRR